MDYRRPNEWASSASVRLPPLSVAKFSTFFFFFLSYVPQRGLSSSPCAIFLCPFSRVGNSGLHRTWLNCGIHVSTDFISAIFVQEFVNPCNSPCIFPQACGREGKKGSWNLGPPFATSGKIYIKLHCLPLFSRAWGCLVLLEIARVVRHLHLCKCPSCSVLF